METKRIRVMLDVHMRYFTPSDMVDVTDIAEQACREPWREADFRAMMATRGVCCRVAVRGQRPLGFVVYKAHKDSLEILNIAVHPDFQRHRVGTKILQNIARKLHAKRRKFAFIAVSERDLGMQLFLRDRDYKATAVHRNHFGKDHDCYVFEKKADDAGEVMVMAEAKEAARG